MGKSKTFTNVEYVDEEKEKQMKETLFCVRTGYWEGVFLKKVIDKKLFKSKKDAEKYFNSVEIKDGYVIELSIYKSGNERNLKIKKDPKIKAFKDQIDNIIEVQEFTWTNK